MQIGWVWLAGRKFKLLFIIGRLATLGFVSFLLAWVGMPAEGKASLASLVDISLEGRVVPVENMSPGDAQTFVETFTNHGDAPVDYRLLLVRQGRLWRCDPGDQNLFYWLEWSRQADQHLEPGETETATLHVTLPLGAGNTCQAASGKLQLKIIWYR